MRTFTTLCLLCIAPHAYAQPEAVYKTKYRVIDVHCHSALPTEAALRAEIEVLDQVGIAQLVILDASFPGGTLADWLKLRQKFPERLVVFAKLDFRKVKEPTFFADIVGGIEQAAKSGAQGVKVWKDLGMYIRDGSDKLLKADDPRLDPFWAKCGALGMPVLIHAADPKEYWYPLTYNSFHYGLRNEKDQHYHNPEMPKWEELIRQRDSILKKHPKTNFIGAHMGSLSFDLKQLGETFDKYPNFYSDCAARQRILGRLNPPAVRDFFVKYADRVVFGTDTLVLSKGRRATQSGNISIYPSDDPDWLAHDPADKDSVRLWQEKAANSYAQYLQYFETDRLDLTDPSRSGGAWLRVPGIKLPPEVLEKLYHKNAAKLIPGLAGKR